MGLVSQIYLFLQATRRESKGDICLIVNVVRKVALDLRIVSVVTVVIVCQRLLRHATTVEVVLVADLIAQEYQKVAAVWKH